MSLYKLLLCEPASFPSDGMYGRRRKSNGAVQEGEWGNSVLLHSLGATLCITENALPLPFHVIFLLPLAYIWLKQAHNATHHRVH